ncbi:MAG: hypothetical protein RXR20_00800 [Paraburkholderia sp.]|uniref:ATPase n=1 Tax=Burkholderiaceae TaxID=119060 RepID=UPI0010F44329|nr:ATPase [Burkholderia sp. 4M9327F10]
MRITRAWCVELNEVVTIDVARRVYLSLENPPSRFNFLCSNKACRDAEVRVVGANYRKAAEDGEKFQAAHFRHWIGDAHLQDCEWLEDEASGEQKPGESEEAFHQRRVRRKLSDYITTFDPRLDDDPGGDGKSDGPTGPGQQPPEGGTPRPRGGGTPDDTPGETRSNDLERLVNNYREARETLTWEEFQSLEIGIVGAARIRLANYFVPVTRGQHYPKQRVLYGGASFLKSYGQGFKLCFYDRIDGKRVYVYISSQQMLAYRFRKYLRGIIDQIPLRRYVTVYAIGTVRQSQSGDSFDLIVDDVRQLALILGPRRAETDSTEKVEADDVNER